MAIATIRDVARVADVSVASVSRALNGHCNVRPALRQRVEQAAAGLGYVPHAGARSLSLARTGAIGVMLPDIHGEYFSESMRGMDREASARGLQLLLANVHADPHRAAEALRTMRGRVDGMIIMAPDMDATRLLVNLPRSVPAVLINCADTVEGRAQLRVDNHAGAMAMAAHLIATGRRRIVHIAGPVDNVEARARMAGYTEAMTRAGLEARVLPGDFQEESGSAMGKAIARDPTAVDAIFAANDMMAIGAIMALRRAAIDVPGRIAVAGFDDIPLARMISPALTTMRVDIAGMGARAVAKLAAALEGTSDDAVEPRLPQLVVRETTTNFDKR